MMDPTANTILSKRMGRPTEQEQSWMLLNMSFVYLHKTAVGIWYTLFASCPCQMPNCPPFVDGHDIAYCVLKSEFALHAGRVQGIFIGHESDLLLSLSLRDGLTRKNCCSFVEMREGGPFYRPKMHFWKGAKNLGRALPPLFGILEEIDSLYWPIMQFWKSAKKFG